MFQATHKANPVSVNAATILGVSENADSGELVLRLSDGRNYQCDTSLTVRHYPAPGDYLVTQEDGYEYLNPKHVFERKYSAATSSATDTAIEQEIQTKGLTAPRVTPGDIEANIAHEVYFTAADAVRFAYITSDPADHEDRERKNSIIDSLPTRSYSGACIDIDANTHVPASLPLLTFCVLVLRNGFTVTGESACASPENFNADLGRKIAHQNAISKVWPLMGYALKERLHCAAIAESEGVDADQP